MGITASKSRTVVVSGAVNLGELIDRLSDNQTDVGLRQTTVNITHYDPGNDPREVRTTTFHITETR